MCINLFRSRTNAIYTPKITSPNRSRQIHISTRKKKISKKQKLNPSWSRRIKSGIFSSPSAAALSANFHVMCAGALQIGYLPLLQCLSWHVSKNSVNKRLSNMKREKNWYGICQHQTNNIRQNRKGTLIYAFARIRQTARCMAFLFQNI